MWLFDADFGRWAEPVRADRAPVEAHPLTRGSALGIRFPSLSPLRYLLAALLWAALPTNPAFADAVTVYFTATLLPTSGRCDLDCLGLFGPELSGSWSFDDAASGSGSNPRAYPLDGIEFTTAFGVTGGGTSGTISIADDIGTPPADAYTIGVSGEFSSLVDLDLVVLTLQMIDTDGSVFSSTDLPGGAPPVSAFETAYLVMDWEHFGVPSFLTVWEIQTALAVPIGPGDFVVNSELDGGDSNPGDGVCLTFSGLCTLRAAIIEANALSGHDRIVVPPGTYLLSLTGTGEDQAQTGDLDVTDGLAIDGAGAGLTIIDADGIDRVFEIRPSTYADIRGVTIRGGLADEAGTTQGGGILSWNQVVLEDCEVTDNVANLAGGIMNRGYMLLRRCLVHGNRAEAFGFTNSQAGGIASASTSASSPNAYADIIDSAIFDNTAPSIGGIELGNAQGALVVNTTVSGNSAPQVRIANANASLRNVTIRGSVGEGLSTYSFDGSHSLLLANTVSEGSPACSLNLSFPVNLILTGYNASNDSSCGFNGSGDVVAPNLLDPTLSLIDGTMAHLPAAGSPLIDGGYNAECRLTDQRGFDRPIDGDGDGFSDCDIGAIELPEPSVVHMLSTGWIALGLLHRARRRADKRHSVIGDARA